VLAAGPWCDAAAAAQLRDLQRAAKADGLWALGHPVELGGGGLPFMDYVYVNEVVGMSEHALAIFGTHSLQDAIMLRSWATPEWRERYLAPLVAGDFAPSFAMTEPEVSSSDPTQLRTTARLEGGEWVIDGHKWFTSEAHSARYTVVMVRTESEDTPPHQAFSMIIVPTDSPGYEVVRAIPCMGSLAGDHCEVRLDNVRVPFDNLLGPRGSGFRIAQERLGPGRIFHAMRWLGQAERAFDLMCARATSRFAFGSLLSDKQLVQEMVFQTAAEIRSARLLTLDAAQRLDAGDPARVEVSMVKVVGARMLHNAIDRAIQVFGAAGVSGDLPLEQMYRNARFARILDGPDETHIANASRLLLRPYLAAAKVPSATP
jgi:alkylation response protein AidB-like acyl-CoA dehydrogenase